MSIVSQSLSDSETMRAVFFFREGGTGIVKTGESKLSNQMDAASLYMKCILSISLIESSDAQAHVREL
jgi:hypothetical protein